MLQDTVESLVQDCADQVHNLVRHSLYRLGKANYSNIISEVKERNLSRIKRLGIACNPYKKSGSSPDEFGSLLGKELAKRKALKKIAKKDPYYSNPMSEQENKKLPSGAQAVKEVQMSFINVNLDGVVTIK